MFPFISDMLLSHATWVSVNVTLLGPITDNYISKADKNKKSSKKSEDNASSRSRKKSEHRDTQIFGR